MFKKIVSLLSVICMVLAVPMLVSASIPMIEREVVVTDCESISSRTPWNVFQIDRTLASGTGIVSPQIQLRTGDTVVFNLTQSIIGLDVGIEGATNRSIRTHSTQVNHSFWVASNGMHNSFIDNMIGSSIRVTGTVTFNTSHAFGTSLYFDIDGYIHPGEELDFMTWIDRVLTE